MVTYYHLNYLCLTIYYYTTYIYSCEYLHVQEKSKEHEDEL